MGSQLEHVALSLCLSCSFCFRKTRNGQPSRVGHNPTKAATFGNCHPVLRVHGAMPKETKSKAAKKTPAPAPYEDPKKKAAAKEPTGPIWEKKPRNFAIGGDIQVRQ